MLASTAILHQFTEGLAQVANKAQDPTNLARTILSGWAWDKLIREPGQFTKAIGERQPVTPDLSSLLLSWAQEGERLTFTKYCRTQAASVKEGESRVWRPPVGKLLSLTANPENFSFSAKIHDETVIESENPEATGKPRNYSLYTHTGEHVLGQRVHLALDSPGYRYYEPYIGTSLPFVHPERYESLHNPYYLLMKVLITRIQDEAKYRRGEKKKMGLVSLPDNIEGDHPPRAVPLGNDPMGSVYLDALEVEVLCLEMEGSYYPPPNKNPHSPENTEYFQKESYWSYTLVPNLRFATRAIEYAVYLKMKADGEEAFTEGWDHNYYRPRERKRWHRKQTEGELVLLLRQWKTEKKVTEKAKALIEGNDGSGANNVLLNSVLD